MHIKGVLCGNQWFHAEKGNKSKVKDQKRSDAPAFLPATGGKAVIGRETGQVIGNLRAGVIGRAMPGQMLVRPEKAC
ncbi:hypothetical protein [Shewanella cyperi]|uniref:hypothetical protein n=1 Tax=Shewanella cyperi TaxID=2814292 RepID=UPI001A949EEA|nr:hypothetical protein [Shewanella cyperi]QSX41952.1 hypothetical protein JYB84_05945 [Shewanella cyperi]